MSELVLPLTDDTFGDACDELLRRVDKLERINGELCAEVNKLTAERELYRSLFGKALDFADEIIALGMEIDEGMA